ncbi:MAG: hypothetical protein RJQ09_03005 [Cyclobacteriaceae bacterium]
MKRPFQVCILFILTALLVTSAKSALLANNVAISNVTLTGQDTGNDFTLIQFDISWENSWRVSSGPANYDAVWVFAKYRVGGGAWNHVWLNEDGVGHTEPTGSDIDIGLEDDGSAFNATTNPGLGAFIYREADGSGTFALTGVQLRWNYGANGLADSDGVDLKLFAIEMVYIPEGAFWVGTGGTETNSFTDGEWTAGNTVPLQITSENALTIAQNDDDLWATGGISAAALPAAYPKGFNDIYSMKYEISQQGYTDFLNSLDATQATARYPTAFGSNRYSISSSGGVYSTSAPYLAVNFISWADLAAYLDWSGLRPMTELEFRKICRGTIDPFIDELAWGTTTIAPSAYTLSDANAANEEIASNYHSGGNASYSLTDGSQDGPVRVGIFASNVANTGRETSGASFYGVMEMSGNLWEIVVLLSNATGLAFDGEHGNGAIDSGGDADVTNWPGTNATGTSRHGGAWSEASTNLRTAYRNVGVAATRELTYGGRGVRTAP